MKVKLFYKQGEDEAGTVIDVPEWKAKVMIDSLLGEYADKDVEKAAEKRDSDFQELVDRAEHMTVEELDKAKADAKPEGIAKTSVRSHHAKSAE